MISRDRVIVIAIVAILIILLATPTRWTVISQLPINTQMGLDAGPKKPVSIVGTPVEHDVEAQIASANQQDYESGMLNGSQALERWAHLTALYNRRPDQPAIIATLLRLQMMAFHDDYSKRDLFLQVATRDDHGSNPQNFLTNMESEAAAGERLEPDNAYFSFMRATILFTIGRDDDAVQAIKAAGDKTSWNEYLIAEASGYWKLADLRSDGPKSIRDLSIMGAVLFPHYARLRTAATSAIYCAMQLEEKGQTEDALSIRLAVMKLGALMRSTQAQSAITALVGIAIGNISIERPGGAVLMRPFTDSGEDNATSTSRLAEFTDYLRQTHHEGAIAPITDEVTKGQEARAILKKTLADKGIFAEGIRYSLWHMGGMAYLDNLIVLALFIAAAALALPRISRFNTRLTGIALLSGIGIGALVPFLPQSNATFAKGFATALGCTAVAEIVFCCLFYRLLRNIERRKSILGYSAIAAGVTAIILWPINYAISGQISSIQGLFSSDTSFDPGSQIWPISCVVTALLWIITGIVSLIRRSPIVPNFLQRFVTSGRVVAVTMLALYTVYAVVITVWDQRLDQQFRKSAGHEIAQAAAMTGHPWPAPTDFSAVR